MNDKKYDEYIKNGYNAADLKTGIEKLNLILHRDPRNREFVPGDVVYLKSDPTTLMTVYKSAWVGHMNDNNSYLACECCWFNDNKDFKKYSIPIECLIKIEKVKYK